MGILIDYVEKLILMPIVTIKVILFNDFNDNRL